MCASCASTGLCGGQRVTVVPTATIRLLIGDVSDSNECSEVENSRIEVVTLVVAKTAILI